MKAEEGGVAVVVGAGGGLGAGLARRFAGAGMEVAIASRDGAARSSAADGARTRIERRPGRSPAAAAKVPAAGTVTTVVASATADNAHRHGRTRPDTTTAPG